MHYSAIDYNLASKTRRLCIRAFSYICMPLFANEENYSYYQIVMNDLLHFDSTYGAIICKPRQYALVPREIKCYLRTQDLALTKQQIATLALAS